MKITAKKWFKLIIFFTVITLFLAGAIVCYVDPFFHYRAPRESLYYTLYEQRSQNDGITRNFSYDAIITGTSMAENFKTSQFNWAFGTNAIKVVYSGATYKELNENLKRAYESGHEPRYVLRPLDYSLLLRDKDELRLDMGEYPEYLTNSNPFDDVKYLLNKDVIVNYTIKAVYGFIIGKEGGHTSFDEYSYTGDNYIYSRDSVTGARESYGPKGETQQLSDEEKEMLMANMEQNVVSLAREHPETTFLYFFPPYSMDYWGGGLESGEYGKILESKRIAIEQMLECDNIHIYSFSFCTDITADLDRYRDAGHYDPEVNEWIIDQIKEAENDPEEYSGSEYTCGYRLTKDNYKNYCDSEKELIESFDYNSMMK